MGTGERVAASSNESRTRFNTDAEAFIPAAMMTRPEPSTTSLSSGDGRSTVIIVDMGGASIPFFDVFVWIVRLFVSVRLLPGGELHLLSRRVLVRHPAEKVRDDVQARATLVV